MPKLKMVVDEWLWADLDCENGESAQGEALKFLRCALERCDKLVTVERSPFLEKFFRFTRTALPPTTRKIAKFFKLEFFYNSGKLLRLSNDALPALSEDIAGRVKDDDHYLAQAYLAAGADLVVTTDSELIRALSECGFRCEHRDRFLQSYLD